MLCAIRIRRLAAQVINCFLTIPSMNQRIEQAGFFECPLDKQHVIRIIINKKDCDRYTGRLLLGFEIGVHYARKAIWPWKIEKSNEANYGRTTARTGFSIFFKRPPPYVSGYTKVSG